MGAAAGFLLLIITWFATFHVAVVQRADHSILNGFAGLHRPRVDALASFIANLCDPKPYVFLAAAPVLAAMLRRRPRVAVAAGAIMLGANLTTQLLKPLLAAPRGANLGWPFIGPASWPSGHATAVMALVLCAVLAAPARRRPFVAAVMAGFAVAVCYSFLELAWHYPTDVLGGFEVAGTWTLLGVAGLAWLEERRPAPRPVPGSARGAQVSFQEAVAPMVLLILAALVCAAVIGVARPAAVISYASAHKLFIVGATAIAALGMAIATGFALVVRRG